MEEDECGCREPNCSCEDLEAKEAYNNEQAGDAADDSETKDEETENNGSDAEELAEFADDKVDALINLLIKKGIITEQELNEEYESIFEESDDDLEEDESGEESQGQSTLTQ